MKTTFVLCLHLLGVMACVGQFDPVRLEKLDRHIREALRDENIPGAVVAVVQGTNIVFSKGYGDGVTPETPFKIGSVSKSFTAIAIMQLEERGQLDLESPVRRYLPWFRTQDELESDKITIRHLLYHRSGISDRNSGFRPDRNYDLELTNLVRACPQMRVISPPGQQFAYSNVGYDFLGAIVTTVSGIRLPEYLQTNILAPLGMTLSHTSVLEASRRVWPGRSGCSDDGDEEVLRCRPAGPG